MKRRLVAVFSVLTAVLAVTVLLAFTVGSARFTLKEMFAALFNGGDETVRFILLSLRLPRIAAAALAGAGLSVAGLLLQTVTDNDLCSPSVIGVNAGAGFAVIAVMCIFPAAYRLLPFAAFAGAAAATLTVLGISFSVGRAVRTKVVLAGVAVAALLNAGISFFSQLYPDVLASYASFSAGGFSDIYADDLIVPAIMIAGGVAVASVLSRRINLLVLGDDIAAGLGTAVKPLRFFTLLLASMLCGAVVSFAGLLGFAGLIVPHMARRIAGHDLRVLVPVCVLCGASLVILSDLAARTLFSPAELPAGILMAALGAPFFLYLLFRGKRTV